MDLIHVLGGGLEPPRLPAYAPQTYVSAISPPERFRGTQLVSRTVLLASISRPQSAPCTSVGGSRTSLLRASAFDYDGGMTAILIPFLDQACSKTFGQSSSANSSVTISLTLILPLSR